MAKSLLINKESVSLPKDLDANSPYEIVEVSGAKAWENDWVRFEQGRVRVWIYNLRNLRASGGNLYAQWDVATGSYHSYLSRGCASPRPPKRGGLFTRSTAHYTVTPLFRCNPRGCTLKVNYADGTKDDLGSIPCDAQIEIVKDCLFDDCEPLVGEVLNLAKVLTDGM